MQNFFFFQRKGKRMIQNLGLFHWLLAELLWYSGLSILLTWLKDTGLLSDGGKTLIDTFSCSWWQHAANLASYEQQDAHEFFISMLDGIHEKIGKDKRKTQSQGKLFIGANLSFMFSHASSNMSVCFSWEIFQIIFLVYDSLRGHQNLWVKGWNGVVAFMWHIEHTGWHIPFIDALPVLLLLNWKFVNLDDSVPRNR